MFNLAPCVSKLCRLSISERRENKFKNDTGGGGGGTKASVPAFDKEKNNEFMYVFTALFILIWIYTSLFILHYKNSTATLDEQ
jgi:preprotein translocase subunit SecG